MAAEDEDVEVDFPGPPACPGPAAELRLDRLAGPQEGKTGRCGIAGDRDIEGDGGVEIGRLLRGAHRTRPIEVRDASKRRVRQLGEGAEDSQQRLLSVAEVRAEPEVGP